MERDTGQHSALETDASSLTNELKLVNIDTSGEQASSPTCPLNLLVRSPISNKTELELSDPFLIGTGSAGGGGGDMPVPTDELVDFREKGSREADGSERGEDGGLDLIGDDALDQFSGEADMENIFKEALEVADRFLQAEKLDEAEVSLVDSVPHSLPGESELLSLDSTLLAALAEERRRQPPRTPRTPALPDSPLDSSFPAPSGPFSVTSLRAASAAAVVQVAAAVSARGSPSRTAASEGTGEGAERSDTVSDLPPAPTPAPAPVVVGESRSSPARRLGNSAVQQPESDPEPAVNDAPDVPALEAPATPDALDAPVTPAHEALATPAVRDASAARAATATPVETPSRLAFRQRDSLAVAAGRRLAAPSPAPAPAPSPEDDAGYANLCQQASAELRELERQADEEYENRQFEQLERRVSREGALDTDIDPGTDPVPEQRRNPAADTTDMKRRSQLSRKETYICRPNSGTFRVEKKQRFGTFKVDKTGTFKIPRCGASAARSLPPEPANGDEETTWPEEETRGDTPASGLNGTIDTPSDSLNNTFCHYPGERSPSPPQEDPLHTSTPDRPDPRAPLSAPGHLPALRRPVTSTPLRSVGSSGSSIGVTPIRGGPADSPAEESPLRVPAAALKGPGLRQPAGVGLRQPGGAAGLKKPVAGGLRQPAVSGLKQPAASGLKQPAASGLRQPAASGLKQPAAGGLKQPAVSGLKQPADSGLRQPSAGGLKQPSASGLRQPSSGLRQPGSSLRQPAGSGLRPPSAGAPRQTAAQLRQTAAQSGSDSSVCSVRSLPGPNTSRSNPSLVADRSDAEPAPSLRQPRQPPGPASRLPGRGGVRRSAGGTGSLTNISLQASHSAAGGGLRRPATARNRTQETSKLSMSQQAAGSERF